MGKRAEYDVENFLKCPDSLLEYKTEISGLFIEGMKNRMIVSYHKYEKVAEGFPEKIDALDSLIKRVDKYKETGNTEWLMDVANFAMIEFMHPSHPDAHFKATSSAESIGRSRTDGEVNDRRNV